MRLPLIFLIVLLPFVLSKKEKIGWNIHGNFGLRLGVGAAVDKEEMLVGAESSRSEREVPFEGVVGALTPLAAAQITVVPVPPSPVPVIEQHIHHHHIDHVVTHEEQVPEIDVWDIRDSVPGTPNEDYPVLRSIPKTEFSCDGRIPGYYADADTKCQVFHRCSKNEESKKMDSFLCLNGTTFNQEILSCDWWENVRCENAHKFFGLNKELNMKGEDGKYTQLSAKRDSNSTDKSLSARIIPKDERTPLPPQFRSPLNRIQATESPPGELSDEDIEEVSEVDLQDPPEISEIQDIPSTTEVPLKEADEEDEDIAYFFTPKQIKDIRSSKDFGDKLVTDEIKSSTLEKNETKNSNSGLDEMKNLNSDSDETKISNSDSDGTKNSNSELDETKNSNSDSDETKNSNSELDETKNSNSDSDETKNSNSELDETKNSNSDSDETKNSTSDSDETQNSNSDLDETKNSNSELDETKNSNTDSDETKNSTSDLDETKNSNTDSDETKNSTSDLDEKKNSNSDSDETRNSTSELDETKSSSSDLDETKNSNLALNETKTSNSALNETRNSKSALNETKTSNSALNKTKPSNSALNQTKPSNSALNETKKSNSVIDKTTKTNSPKIFKPMTTTTTTRRTPVYKSSRIKTAQLFETSKNEKPEEEDLFEKSVEDKKRSSKITNTVQTEDTTSKPKRVRRLRKVKKSKTRKEKETDEMEVITLKLGYPFPSQQVIMGPNGTSTILKYKHLLHTDITESYPPYVSGVKPIHPVYPPYPYGHAPFPYHPANLSPVIPHPNFNPLQPALYPVQPAVTYEHHHHHKAGTHHRALEPHHVYPNLQAQSGTTYQKLLAPHEVIPALYHPDIVLNQAGSSKTNSKEPMHLVQPHHGLRVHPIAVNLGDRFHHHHHQVLPDNPLAAHHYAAESHLAVASYHHLAEPHIVKTHLPQFVHNSPAIYSQRTPQSSEFNSIYPSAHAPQLNSIYAQLPGQNPAYASGPVSFSIPVQGSAATPVYALDRTQEQSLTDILRVLNSG